MVREPSETLPATLKASALAGEKRDPLGPQASWLEVRERHEGYALASALELHFLELPKLVGAASEREETAVP